MENAHSIANFKPEEYEVLDYLDNQPPRIEHVGFHVPALEAAIEAWRRDIARYFPTSAAARKHDGPQLPEHNIHRCRHCGNCNVRYIVAVCHRPTGVNIVFGNECVEHLGFANRSAFKAAQVRARAEAGHARLRVWHKRTEFLSHCPELAAAVAKVDAGLEVHRENHFARDLVNKLNQYGELSPRQIECFLESLKRDESRAQVLAERAAEKARMIAAGVRAPAGRVQVEGVVLTTRVQDSDYGLSYKWLVKLDSGAKVWSSIPSAVLCTPVETMKGLRVRFTAAFELSQDDPTFAFGSRPTKAVLIAEPTAAV